MDADREQELEQRIDELEATVRGLTEELVDLGERLRHVEDVTDVQDTPAPRSDVPEPEDLADDADPATESDEESADDAEDADDIIVA
ncbi:MAG: bZIP transcription factor [Halobacteriaceae archaeon]